MILKRTQLPRNRNGSLQNYTDTLKVSPKDFPTFHVTAECCCVMLTIIQLFDFQLPLHFTTDRPAAMRTRGVLSHRPELSTKFTRFQASLPDNIDTQLPSLRASNLSDRYKLTRGSRWSSMCMYSLKPLCIS